MIRNLLILMWLGALVTPATAQDRSQTLADIRSELSALASDLQALRSQLVTTGGPTLQGAGGASALERMDALEAEVVRLTSRTEELQNRVNLIVSDGTNRISDLEFRLCELEEGCDIANMPITAMLGGEAGAPPAGQLPAITPGGGVNTGASGGVELATGEQAAFDRGRAALDQGEFPAAADLFAAFSQAYTGGPLTGEAHFLRGEALAQMGETANAARAYLEAFSGQPNGPRAADALLRLGQSLADLGQVQEACVTLAEVGTRFPNASAALEANSSMQSLGCQ